MEQLVIRGARQHNLKNITLALPKNSLIVFTGVSGSGKSSLAFDTIYAEGQRRYVESLSSYARQFLGVMDKPDVDAIEGLSPAISIDQKSTSHNPRSTVGTVTEIYDYLRLLYARIGHPHCPSCGREIARLSRQQMTEQILDLAREKLSERRLAQLRFFILAPVVRDRKGEFSGLFANLKTKGYRTIRVDGRYLETDSDMALIKTNKHTIDVVIDRVSIDRKTVKFLDDYARSEGAQGRGIPPGIAIRSRIGDAVEQAANLSDGLVIVTELTGAAFDLDKTPKQTVDHLFSEKFSCPVCNISIPEIEPRTFSFNTPHGACPDCSGLGEILTVDPSRVINPELSITEGGILPFARMFFHDTWFSRVITTMCDANGIDPRKALKHAGRDGLKALLYGTGERLYTVIGKNRFGDTTRIEERYPGIVPELKRRYSQSESDFVRTEIEKYMRTETCTACGGRRLKPEALTVTVEGKNIAAVTDLSIADARAFISSLPERLSSPSERTIAAPIVKEVSARLGFLTAVGLEYLTLARSATTLAGGEAQRIRLASQIGSGLSGVLYVLDEPSIGLHQRDNRKLIDTLVKLRDLGNTVIVVEHDREMMEHADYLVDFGPGAGENGGAVVAAGTVREVKSNPLSLTGAYLRDERRIRRKPVRAAELPASGRQLFEANEERHTKAPELLTLTGASEHNLQSIRVSFPIGTFICVTGLSGSGKSSLVVETLYPALAAAFSPMSKRTPGAYTGLTGTDALDNVILIDQSPIGRTPRSNPATYTGIFSPMREIYAELPESRLRGYKAGRFSFNVKGGRCEACEGEGQRKIEMQFLSDIYVTCEVCHGKRYNTETLDVLYHGKSIADVLDMTVDEALEFFRHYPGLSEKLSTIHDVGLGYIHLGQPAPTLSGGEAQRVKLATELSRKTTGKTVYILDEPTTGLHFADLEKLLDVLSRLTALGNTVIVIEHNLDIIKNADWIIDLGPEGGENGGKVVATGTPRDIAQNPASYTGRFLKELLGRG
ncbi:excinuclease ABC subunit UvrA [Patescibacteria group bacterium]|nr:excinuclease ABC subunit UvrA [Patescibacteria group bacterium]